MLVCGEALCIYIKILIATRWTLFLPPVPRERNRLRLSYLLGSYQGLLASTDYALNPCGPWAALTGDSLLWDPGRCEWQMGGPLTTVPGGPTHLGLQLWEEPGAHGSSLKAWDSLPEPKKPLQSLVGLKIPPPPPPACAPHQHPRKAVNWLHL